MSQKNKPKKSFEPGEVRSSQIITTWGPGSIVQMEEDSVIVMGLDMWPEAFTTEEDLTKYKVIHHPFLETICDKEHFRMPQSEDKIRAGIPCNSFPTWGYCSFKGCRRLQRHHGIPDKGKFYCEKDGNELIPARLITICKHGHLDEFPWIEWAHSKRQDQEGGICDEPKLKWASNNRSSSLSAYYVSCESCEKWRNMYGALNTLPDLPNIEEKNISKPFICKGSRPWLTKPAKCPPKNENSKVTRVQGILTRTTGLYFASVINALHIPKYRHKIHLAIDSKFQTIQSLREDGDSLEQIAERNSIFKDVMQDYTKSEIVEKLEERFNPNVETELDIRTEEYRDILGTDFEGDDLIDISNVELDNKLNPYFSALKKVDRLTLVKALRYFTRIQPPDPFSTKKTNHANFCGIYNSNKINWLPCVEHKGEGIFVSLNEKKLSEWEKREDVKERCKPILDAYYEWSHDREWESRPLSPRYLLLHTLSHALIRELSFTSGYSESAIAERIYAGSDFNAILAYTASASSDGSLGGLVRQGELTNFESLMENVVKKSKLCSRDPLCIEDDPKLKEERGEPAHARFNGSACYACCLLPETSCEEFNRLLDRKLLFDKKIGYFSDFIE